MPLTALAATPDLKLYDQLAVKHGHFCPMSTLGLRLGWAARRLINSKLQMAVYKHQTCATDGIRLALDSNILQVENQGQHLLQITDSEQEFILELTPAAMSIAASYRYLSGESARHTLLENLRRADEKYLVRIDPTGMNI